MKKAAIIILALIACLAIGFGILSLTDFDKAEGRMIEAMAEKCVKDGMSGSDFGPKCLEAMCGEKAANAGFPMAKWHIRKCHEKVFGKAIGYPKKIPTLLKKGIETEGENEE